MLQKIKNKKKFKKNCNIIVIFLSLQVHRTGGRWIPVF